MTKIMSRYCLGDMVARYLTDEDMHTELELFPFSMEEQVVRKKDCGIDSMIQWKKEGDDFPYGFASGMTMRNSASVRKLKWKDQKVSEEDNCIKICTVMEDDSGNLFSHTLTYGYGSAAVAVDIEVQNHSGSPFTLEMLSSFSVGGISVFTEDEGSDRLYVHRMRSKWSGEGKMETRSAEELLLEPTWSRHGVYSEKFGQLGSLPVRGYFPFAAVEDRGVNVVWAAAMEAPASWQMEIYRRDNGLCMSGGLPDYDYGHWCKKLDPGETFQAPRAYLTVCRDTVDSACQRLSAMWTGKENKETLPIIFNEFCTTWGRPSQENISRILKVLKGKPVDVFVIDAGWYAKGFWWDAVGEWIESRERFPNGIREVTDYIRAKGMIPGIWLELEVMGINCEMAKKLPDDWFFTRHGKRVYDRSRYQLDYRNPKVREYATSVIDRLIRDYGIGYIKMDYNIEPGIGTEYQAENPGDGLLEHERAYLKWLDGIFEKYPELIIENCSSGGLRMDYAMLSRYSIQSTSDEEDYRYYATIAANAPAGLTPEQAAVWSYPLPKGDREEVVFNMVNAMLLRVHQSGHLNMLSQERKDLVKEGLDYYKTIRYHIKEAVPFWPLGLSQFEDEWVSLGLRAENKIYLAVWRRSGNKNQISLPLPVSKEEKESIQIRCAYPSYSTSQFAWNSRTDTLTVQLEKENMARLFEITLS